MGVDVIGATITASTVMYGASSGGGGSVTFGSFYDSGASLSIAPTTLNTKWLIEVDADIDTTSGMTFVTGLYLKAKVDGSYVATTGVRYGGSGSLDRELTVRGRAVVTLATVAPHTIVAAVHNPSGDSRATVTLTAITITATQLTG